MTQRHELDFWGAPQEELSIPAVTAEQARREVAQEIFEEIETMYPELRGVYWRGKNWLDFKAKYLKGGS